MLPPLISSTVVLCRVTFEKVSVGVSCLGGWTSGGGGGPLDLLGIRCLWHKRWLEEELRVRHVAGAVLSGLWGKCQSN